MGIDKIDVSFILTTPFEFLGTGPLKGLGDINYRYSGGNTIVSVYNRRRCGRRTLDPVERPHHARQERFHPVAAKVRKGGVSSLRLHQPLQLRQPAGLVLAIGNRAHELPSRPMR